MPFLQRSLLLAGVLAVGLGSLRAQGPEPVVRNPELAARDAEIQKNSGKFELFPIEYDAEDKAVFRYIDPAKNFFVYKGMRYFGFRFKTPPVLEGNFTWMFLLRSRLGPTHTEGGYWYILRRNGAMRGFSDFQDGRVRNYPKLREKFPYTEDLTVQDLDKGAFLPNEEYLIWFSLKEGDNPVEYAVAFAFLREGRSRRSRMPLGPTTEEMKGQERKDEDLQSYVGDPW